MSKVHLTTRALCKDDMTDEQIQVRRETVIDVLAARERAKKGELKLTARAKAKLEAREKNRLRMTVAKELREIQEKARQYAEVAMDTLAEISQDKDAPSVARISASAVILDRAYGKAMQATVTAQVVDDVATAKMTEKELDERIRDTLVRVEKLATGEAEAEQGENRPTDLRQYN